MAMAVEVALARCREEARRWQVSPKCSFLFRGPCCSPISGGEVSGRFQAALTACTYPTVLWGASSLYHSQPSLGCTPLGTAGDD